MADEPRHYLRKTLQVVVDGQVVRETSDIEPFEDAELETMKEEGFVFLNGEMAKAKGKADKKVKERMK